MSLLKNRAAALYIATTSIFAIPATSSAVEVASNNLGDVLLFPYFTTRNGYSTFLDIANTSQQTLALKVNLRNATDGSSCARFIVTLSPRDVWIAAIETNAGSPRLRVPGDKSCTFPSTTANNNQIVALNGCTEGSIEIIQMGHSIAGTENVLGTVASRAKNGLCDKIATSFNNNLPSIRQEFIEPINALKGTYTLIKGNEGKAVGGTAVALADFYSPNLIDGKGTDGVSKSDLIFSATDNRPTLADVNPRESILTTDNAPINAPLIAAPIQTYIDRWTSGADAVSAALTAASIHNNWTSNPNFGAETDWIVNFPTKYLYPSIIPFAQGCSSTGLVVTDRASKSVNLSTDLCNQTNVITFDNKNVTASQLAINVDTLGNSFGSPSGWMSANFTLGDGGGLAGNVSGRTYRGLPAIGLSLVTRSVTNANSVDSSRSFGTAWPHAFNRQVTE